MRNLWICICLFSLFSCNRENRLFRIRTSLETSIFFNNKIEETEEINAMTFEYIYNGAGVAVADFNNDGLMDIFFAGNQVSSALFLNEGKLKFQDITAIAGTSTNVWCTGVTVVDINQDGFKDIYVSVAGFVNDSSQMSNLLFENQGLNSDCLPTFQEKASNYGLNDTGYSTQAAFFDYDHDGDLDCYLLTNALEKENRNTLRPKRINGEAPSTDRLYKNTFSEKGEVHFTDVSREAGILIEGYGLGLAISDINGDGWDDIYCSNDFLSNDLMWINNQDGTFSNRAAEFLRHQSHNGMGVEIADLNNDAMPEIMVLDMLPETNERQKMMLAGSNHDRMQLDLKLGYQPQFMRNTLQTRTSLADTYGEISQIAGLDKTDWSWAPLFADFDNDALTDIYITNGYRRDVTNMDFTAYLASLSQGQMFQKKEKDNSAIFNKLMELPEIKLSNYAFKNSGNLEFANVSKSWGLDLSSYSSGACYADFDNDGDLDLVVNNIDDEAFFYENTASESERILNWITIDLNGESGNQNGIGSKVILYADGKLFFRENEPTRGYISSMDAGLHFGLGDLDKIDSLLVRWPDGLIQRIGKIVINQRLTLTRDDTKKGIWPIDVENGFLEQLVNADELGLDFLHVENDYNDFNQNPLLPYKFSRVSPVLVTGDIDNDGLDDLFIGGDFGQTSSIYHQNSKGTFVKFDLEGSEAFEDVAAAFFDFNQDGFKDLYVVSGGSHDLRNLSAYQDRLYMNDGKNAFGLMKDALPITTFPGSSVSLADFDSDGDLDILRGSRLKVGEYPLPPDSYLFVNQSDKGILKFEDKTTEKASGLKNAGLVTAVSWADLNADKLPDMILTGEWMAPSVILQKNGQFQNSEEIVSALRGLWQCMLVQDIDQDGDLDIALGNIGLNTKYNASPQKPLRIYAKDFDVNNRIDPIMSFYLGDDEIPVPTRDLLTMQIPGLKRYFPLYEDFSKAKMNEIFDKHDLRSAYKREVNELRTGWLEQKEKGKFEFQIFDNQIQWTVTNTMLFDKSNLYLYGNSKAPETIGGWWDAGSGRKISFESGQAITLKTGFPDDQEVRSICILKRKNDELFIISSINQPLRIFKKVRDIL